MLSGDSSVKMSIRRSKQLFFFILYRFDGARIGWKGGGAVRQCRVDHAKTVFGTADDDEAIAKAFAY